jgi:hypothetical protein
VDRDSLLLLRTVLALLAVMVYTSVGVVLGRRQLSPEARPANRAFQAWWFGLAGLSLFNPVMYAMVRAGVQDLQVYLALFEFLIVAVVGAVGCLVYYLLYVYTGRTWVFWPVAIYHVVILSWILTVITQAHPIGYGEGCPNLGFCYEKDFNGTPASRWIGASLVLPILLATVGYFALYFRVEEPVQRYRIALVSTALMVWFGTSLTGSLVVGDYENLEHVVRTDVPLSQWRYWSLVTNTVGLLAAVAILLAYRPPLSVQRLLEARRRT